MLEREIRNTKYRIKNSLDQASTIYLSQTSTKEKRLTTFATQKPKMHYVEKISSGSVSLPLAA